MNKHLRYLNYVIRHKWFVFVAGIEMDVSLWRLIKHDWTKFLPSEWTPYVNNFYGEPYFRTSDPSGRPNEALNRKEFEKQRKDAFEKAWLLHLNRNDHHWQFWLKTDDSGESSCLPMTVQARREMIADWMGGRPGNHGEVGCGRVVCQEPRQDSTSSRNSGDCRFGDRATRMRNFAIGYTFLVILMLLILAAVKL